MLFSALLSFFSLSLCSAASFDPERFNVIKVEHPYPVKGQNISSSTGPFIPLPAPIECDPYPGAGAPGTMIECYYILNAYTGFITSMKIVNQSMEGATKYVVNPQAPNPDNWFSNSMTVEASGAVTEFTFEIDYEGTDINGNTWPFSIVGYSNSGMFGASFYYPRTFPATFEVYPQMVTDPYFIIGYEILAATPPALPVTLASPSAQRGQMDMVQVEYSSKSAGVKAAVADFIPLPPPIDCDDYTGKPGTMLSCFYFLNAFTDFIVSMKVTNTSVSGTTSFVTKAANPTPDDWFSVTMTTNADGSIAPYNMEVDYEGVDVNGDTWPFSITSYATDYGFGSSFYFPRTFPATFGGDPQQLFTPLITGFELTSADGEAASNPVLA